MNYVDDVLAGDRLSLSRLLTIVENNTADGQKALTKLFPHTGRACLIGITGAPGTGKSSLVNQLARHYRQPKDGSTPLKVAVVAVDPSSPFTGGAVLGDRIRMRDLSGDPGVFIRSMASRGSLGGLAKTTSGLVQVFDAAGFDMIMIETVGAGQAEVDIARLAHTTLVIEAPGLGDDIQAIKAGILEIADILVINKADRPGVENTERALRNMLKLAHPAPRVFQHHGHLEKSPVANDHLPQGKIWIPPIQRTIALEGDGIPELAAEIARHQEHLRQSGELAQREWARMQNELEIRIQESLVASWRESISDGFYEETIKKLVTREISPSDAVSTLLDGKNP